MACGVRISCESASTTGRDLVLHVNELPFINNGEHIERVPEISTWMSLGVIIVAMTVATIASLVASHRDKRRDEAVLRAEPKRP